MFFRGFNTQLLGDIKILNLHSIIVLLYLPAFAKKYSVSGHIKKSMFSFTTQANVFIGSTTGKQFSIRIVL